MGSNILLNGEQLHPTPRSSSADIISGVETIRHPAIGRGGRKRRGGPRTAGGGVRPYLLLFHPTRISATFGQRLHG